MKSVLLAVALLVFATGCSKHTKFVEQLDQIEAGLTMNLTVGDLAQISENRTVMDFQFEIQNSSSLSAFLSFVPPQVLSDYLQDRNPKGVGYRVQIKMDTNKWRSTDFGLSSTYTNRYKLKPGDSLSFTVPVPVNGKFPDATQLRLALNLYASIADSDGRTFYSPSVDLTKANKASIQMPDPPRVGSFMIIQPQTQKSARPRPHVAVLQRSAKKTDHGHRES